MKTLKTFHPNTDPYQAGVHSHFCFIFAAVQHQHNGG